MPPRLLRALALLPGLFMGGVAAREPAAAAPIPARHFFQKASVSGAQLSPNGRFVAVRGLSPQGRTMLSVVDTATLQSTSIVNFSNADVAIFYWLNDARLVFTVVNVDHDGDAGKPGLYAVDRDGGARVALAETVDRHRAFAETDLIGHGYLPEPTVHGFVHSPADALYVLERSADEITLRRLSARSGRVNTVNMPRGSYSWLIGADGGVRVAVALRDGRSRVHVREADNGWRQIAEFDPAGADAFTPLLYVDGALYVSARNGADKASIYRYDLAAGALVTPALVSATDVDVGGHVLVDDSKLLGFRFNADAETTVWFDPAMKALQQEIDALMPATVNTIERGSRSETPFVLVDVHSDVQDHAYVLYNRSSKAQVLLGEASPDIVAAQMAPMEMVHLAARDGLPLSAYLTLPAARGRGRPLPMVVLVGDQPWRRNGLWAWQPDVQFLASRGYAVLQPEPRGEDGFGLRHRRAGARQWGRAMQDDIADTVRWAVAQAHADGARVCIAGTGFGGYAALMGLVRDPALFKCAVSWSGLTDVAALLDNKEESADARAPEYVRALVGDPDQDRAQFAANSPLAQASRITQPVLLAYGKDDYRVPFAQGRRLYDAIRAHNSGAEWLAYAPTVADRRTQHNAIALWEHIDAFLARQLGAP